MGNKFWQWFLKYGDKIFAVLTAQSMVLQAADPKITHMTPSMLWWISFVLAGLTAIHNTLLPEPAAAPPNQQEHHV